MDQTNSRAGGMVHVRGYTQSREGHLVQVSDYERSAPPSHTWIAKDPQGFFERWKNQYIGDQQCVALVRKAVPDIGPAKDWHEGEKIRDMNDPPLKHGTAIATFVNGRYMNRKGVSHAAIFLEYGPDRYGTSGMWVLDQFEGKKTGKRHLSFGTPQRSAMNRADSYSVIANPNK